MTDLQALHDATHTMVMGVLNITEDSFSDGGLWLDLAKAAQHGRYDGRRRGYHRHHLRIHAPAPSALRLTNWSASPVPPRH